MSRRHYLKYVLLDARATEADREAARRELAAGAVREAPTVAEWIGPQKSSSTSPAKSICTDGGYKK